MSTTYASERRILDRLVDEALDLDAGKEARLELPDLESLECYLHALHETYVARGLDTPGNITLVNAVINGIVRHEHDHATVARQLDNHDVRFGLHMLPPAEGSIIPRHYESTIWQPNRPISPIEFAAVFIHPLSPSEGDVDNLRKIGFTSIYAATNAILEHNIRTKNPLPVPRSYTLGISHAFEV